MLGLAARALDDPELSGSIGEFVAAIAGDALVNSLGAKLVQLTMVGVPDIYQGCELSGLSLVDPDNRRPVDFARRRALLADLDASRLDLAAAGDGGARLDAAKLLVTARALRLRRARPEWFAGGYAPVTAAGPAADHVVAFARGGSDAGGPAVTVATRLPVGLRARGGWSDTVLPLAGPAARMGGRAHRRRLPRGQPAAGRRDGDAAGGAARSGGQVTIFSVWAPAAGRADVDVAGRLYPMSPAGRPGWWSADVPGAIGLAGTDYAFRLDGGEPLADPRSPRQPSGPAGRSRTYDHAAFTWTDGRWRGAPVSGAVIYELHIGTFTPEGTLDAAIGRLDHLADLGVTVVELMPVAAFPGDHGWGYDGIGLWAVHEPYGGPDALKRFVDACHARGLAVYLDVVYNHVGPGNRLASFGPYFTDAHLTPWGPAVNLDQPGSDEVRAFIVDNALMWLRDYHLDGLRLDAVHALVDTRAVQHPRGAGGRRRCAGRGGGPVDRPGGRVRPQQPAADHGQAGGRLRARRAVERRLPPRRARARDRRAAGVLQRLRRPLRGRQDADQGVFPRRDLVHVPRPDPRPPGRHAGDAGLPVRRVRPGPRPGRQPGGRRPPPGHAGRPPEPARAAQDRVRPGPHRALHADAVHGRGVGRRHAVAVLHRSHRSRAGGGGQRRPPVGVRRITAGARPTSPTRKTRRRSSAPSWTGTSPRREPYRSLLGWYRALLALRRSRPELADPRFDLVRVDYDEDARWLLIHRGQLIIAANLGEAEAILPIGKAAGAARSAPRSAPGVSVATGRRHHAPGHLRDHRPVRRGDGQGITKPGRS